MRNIFFTLVIILVQYSNTLLGSYDKELSNSLFKQANNLYESGEVKRANEIYKRLAIEDKISSTELYYNLSSSYEAMGEIGQAVLWYERLLTINPFDKETLSRLSLIVEGHSSSLKTVFIFVHIFLYVFLLLFTLSAVLFIVSIVSIKYKMAMRKLLYISIVLSTIFLLFTALSQMEYNKKYIVTVQENISLYKGNNLSSDSLKVLSEGTKLEILEEYDVWFYVKMKSGEKGWIYKTHSEKI